MATSPLYPGGVFTLTNADTGVSADAEVTLTADCEIGTVVAVAAASTTVVLAVSDSSGLNYVNVAVTETAIADTLIGSARPMEGAANYTGATGSGAAVTGGGAFPRFLKSGCKIKATRDTSNDTVTIFVSGVTLT